MNRAASCIGLGLRSWGVRALFGLRRSRSSDSPTLRSAHPSSSPRSRVTATGSSLDIPEVVGFSDWAGRDVLEVACGIATDGLQFLRAGAGYTGLDQAR